MCTSVREQNLVPLNLVAEKLRWTYLKDEAEWLGVSRRHLLLGEKDASTGVPTGEFLEQADLACPPQSLTEEPNGLKDRVDARKGSGIQIRSHDYLSEVYL